MKVVDKEAIRTEQENTPEGKKKKLIKRIITAVAVAVFLAFVYWSSRSPVFNGKPFTVSIDGMEIIPGETKVHELIDANFKIGKNEFDSVSRSWRFYQYNTTEKMEKNTFLTGIDLHKDGENIAVLEITNYATQKPISECRVTDVTVYLKNADKAKILIDGTPITDFTLDNLSTYYKDIKESVRGYAYKDKNYKIEFILEEGKIDRILSDFDKNSKQ